MHFHFLIWAADKIEPGTGNYIENVLIDIVVSNAAEAIQRAKKLVPGKNIYTIRQVIEHFENQCSANHH